MTIEALGWYASMFGWLFFTGIGIPPVPEEAGILYAASIYSLHDDVVDWPFAWAATGLGIMCADTALYWLGRWWGPRLFEEYNIWVSYELGEDLPYLLQYVGEDHVVVGTDYGHHEHSLDAKCRAVERQLRDGSAEIVFDPVTGTTDIRPVPR